MAGYCFRCDAPADGEVCPRCGAPLYREEKHAKDKRPRAPTVGESPTGRPPGAGRWALVAVVAVALLLIIIAIVAGNAAGVS